MIETNMSSLFSTSSTTATNYTSENTSILDGRTGRSSGDNALFRKSNGGGSSAFHDTFGEATDEMFGEVTQNFSHSLDQEGSDGGQDSDDPNAFCQSDGRSNDDSKLSDLGNQAGRADSAGDFTHDALSAASASLSPAVEGLDGTSTEINTDGSLRDAALVQYIGDSSVGEGRADSDLENYFFPAVSEKSIKAGMATVGKPMGTASSAHDVPQTFKTAVKERACDVLSENRKVIDALEDIYRDTDAPQWTKLRQAIETDRRLEEKETELEVLITNKKGIIKTQKEALKFHSSRHLPEYKDLIAKMESELGQLEQQQMLVKTARAALQGENPALSALDVSKISAETSNEDVFKDMQAGFEKAREGIDKSIANIKDDKVPLQVLTPVLASVCEEPEFEGLQDDVSKWVADYHSREDASSITSAIVGTVGGIAGGMIGGPVGAGLIVGASILGANDAAKEYHQAGITSDIASSGTINNSILSPEDQESADARRYMSVANMIMAGLDLGGSVGAGKIIAKTLPGRLVTSYDPNVLGANLGNLGKVVKNSDEVIKEIKDVASSGGNTQEQLDRLWDTFIKNKDASVKLSHVDFDKIAGEAYGIPNYSKIKDILGEDISNPSVREDLVKAGYHFDKNNVIYRANNEAHGNNYAKLTTTSDGKIKLDQDIPTHSAKYIDKAGPKEIDFKFTKEQREKLEGLLKDREDLIKQRGKLDKSSADYQKQYEEITSGKISTKSAKIGETAADGYMKENFPDFERIFPKDLETSPSKNGNFDMVYQNKDGEVIIVEAKAGVSKQDLGTRRIGDDRYQQGTPEYLEDVTNKMKRNEPQPGDPADVVKAKEDEVDAANAIIKGAKKGKVKYLHIETRIAEDSQSIKNMRVGEFDIDQEALKNIQEITSE